jgi:hypothetical protein
MEKLNLLSSLQNEVLFSFLRQIMLKPENNRQPKLFIYSLKHYQLSNTFMKACIAPYLGPGLWIWNQ